MLTAEKQDYVPTIKLMASTPADTLRINDANGDAIIRIASNGAIFWNGREVETDTDFKAAMLELRDYMIGINKC